MIDLFLVYNFIKRLATPFIEWDAYELGIIDESGNVLKKRLDLRTLAERKAWGKFDVMISKLKKIIEKAPGGKTRIASYAAALYLIKESENISTGEMLSESELSPILGQYIDYVEENFHVIEEVPANSAGSGNVAGIGVGPKSKSEPGFSKSHMRKYKNKRNVLRR